MRRALVPVLLLAAACARSEAERLADMTSPDPFERVMAVTALAQPHRPEALPLVLDALDDPDTQVREAAGTALTRMGAAAAPGLLEGLRPGAAPRDRLRSLAALPLLGEAAAKPLAGALLDGAHDHDVVLNAFA